MTNLDLHRKLHDAPFRPFRIKLVNSTTYDVLEPWMITIGDSSAIIVTQLRKEEGGYMTATDWRTVSMSHMLEFSDLDVKQRGREKKPA